METSERMKRGRRGETKAWAAMVVLGVWAMWGARGVCAAPHPHPDSPETQDAPQILPVPPPASPPASASSSNAVGMLVLSPRAPIVVVAGGRGSTAEDLVNYYLPVIMAEMDAPVSTRDPSIIRVAGCRQGFNEDPVGSCRPVFVPRTYYPRTSTRPHRQV
ncbi:uncharacterized protein LOC126985812 isoform X2 [Eriocheir sinensis]|uniref:uncharacterized protein LOC126985812 isoform X2 n=1 Tax=Eriocheir sinensis TaxID=95602 RepID=UPI0021C9FA04|nr:uncharacterized protein LOC126985812 isoform X2 [Eriocheir sinensis]